MRTLIKVSFYILFLAFLSFLYPLDTNAAIAFVKDIRLNYNFGPNNFVLNPITNKLYIIGMNSSIDVVDAITGNKLSNIAFPSSFSTYSITVDPIKNKIYVGSYTGNQIGVIDGNTNSITDIINLNSEDTFFGSSIAVNYQTNKVYFSSPGKVWVIDGSNNSQIKKIDQPISGLSFGRGVAINPNTNMIYAANLPNGYILAINGKTDEIVHVISIPVIPYEVAVNTNTNKVYANDANSNGLTIIDGNTNSIELTSYLNFHNTGMDVNPISNRVYISNYYDGTMAVFNGLTNNLIEYFPTGTLSPLILKVNPSNGYIYIGDPNNHNIIILQDILDSIPPITTINQFPVKNSNGWNNTDVNITLNATDNEGGSGVKEIHYSVNGGTENVVSRNTASFTISTEGTNIITYWAVDNAGNVEQTNTYSLEIDKTNPTVTINSPTDGTAYVLNQPVTADWSVSDSLSGIDSYSGIVASGQNIDTSTVGTHIFTVSATDKAGNTTTKIITYYVHYNFGGFQAPLGTNKLFKTGGTIPIKFQLTSYYGNIISNATVYLYVAKITDDIVGTDEAASSTNNADTGNQFRYDSTNNIYIYNLSTQNSPLGSPGTYQLKAVVDDGTYYTSIISLK